MTPERIEQEILNIQKDLKKLEDKINNVRNEAFNERWLLRQRLEGCESAIKGIKSDLSPIFEQSMYNPNYLEDYMANLEKTCEKTDVNNGLINYALDKIDDLEINTKTINSVVIQMGIDAEQMAKSFAELNEALEKLTNAPAGDNPENRLPEQKEDLEIFEQIDTDFVKAENDPLPSYYDMTDGTLRPIFSEADAFIRGSLWY